jgi:hypothetical protein
MLKKLGGVVCLIIMVCGIATIYAQPTFGKYSNTYQIYTGDDSSLAELVTVDTAFYFTLGKKYGESVELNAKDFSLSGILKDFSAKVLFIEQTDSHTLYYASSPKIRYRKKVKGQTVNLQSAVSKDRVVLGAPLIFGSF